MTKEFAIKYIQEECEDCPEYKNGECISNSHCFEVKRMSIQAIRQMFAIEDVKAEINHVKHYIDKSFLPDVVIEIIDKHIGKESE